MNEEGIDIYNNSDSFFNDICYPYTYNGKDIIINDRRDTLYQNNICNNDCKYNGINYDTQTINCKCLTQINDIDTNNNENNKLDIKDGFSKSLSNINIGICKCYQLIFHFKNLKKNIGFLFGGIVIIIEFICFLLFIKFGETKLLSKIMNEIKLKKKQKNKMNVNFISKFSHQINNDGSNSKRRFVNSNKNNLLEILKTKILYQDLPFDLALIKDKRKFWKIFYHNFIEKYPLFRMFHQIFKFEFININIIIYFTYLEITFGLNSLFYTNNQVSSDFNQNLSFLVSILNSLYSFLIGTIILSLLRYLILFSPVLETLIIEIHLQNILIRKIMKFIKIMRIKYFIFLCINFIIIIYFWYYMTLFCIIYHNTQIKWFIRCCLSFFLTLLQSFIFCLILTVIKVCSLKYKNKNLFNFEIFLRQLL